MSDELKDVGCNFGTGREGEEFCGGGTAAGAAADGGTADDGVMMMMLLLSWGKCVCSPEEGEGRQGEYHFHGQGVVSLVLRL